MGKREGTAVGAFVGVAVVGMVDDETVGAVVRAMVGPAVGGAEVGAAVKEITTVLGRVMPDAA